MRDTLKVVLIVLLFNACVKQESNKPLEKPKDWTSRQVSIENFDSLYQGKTYLPVYSHIYHIHEHRTFHLTITVSIRNISPFDSVYILKADYFNTTGENIRQYIKKPIYLKPLETIEIVIDDYLSINMLIFLY